ncbi:hypothetical protein I311_04119 [Cryptococcus gattii NT-10]|nr:hypothetical protein I311_04119 [Cryptococcus gattii NT-10]
MALIAEMESGDWRTYKNADPLVLSSLFLQTGPQHSRIDKIPLPLPLYRHFFLSDSLKCHPSSLPLLLLASFAKGAALPNDRYNPGVQKPISRSPNLDDDYLTQAQNGVSSLASGWSVAGCYDDDSWDRTLNKAYG